LDQKVRGFGGMIVAKPYNHCDKTGFMKSQTFGDSRRHARSCRWNISESYHRILLKTLRTPVLSSVNEIDGCPVGQAPDNPKNEDSSVACPQI
jgi:hypothetical protein